ncbi:MAG: hypothetical protein ABJM82_01065 [Shimia thalassica]|uniref:hypothetical protein n=1 Tax=Rhodobacterales TaxID=204455 RepID=UPI0032984E7D
MEDDAVVEAQRTLLQSIGESTFAPVTLVLCACVVFGGFGGLVALWASSENEEAERKGLHEKVISNLKSSAIGIGGAFGFMFFTLAVGGITDAVVSKFAEQLRLLSICFISGFGARRLLPQMAGHLEQQIAQANKEASEAKAQAHSTVGQVSDLSQQLDTMKIRTRLKHAIDSPDADRVWKTALAEAKEIIRARTTDIPSFWIDVARIEMRYVSIEAALDTIADMLALMESGKLPKNINYPTAFFNRACYYSKLFEDSGDERYCGLSLENLRKLLEVAESPSVFSKYVESDPQLEAVRSNKGFADILDMFKNAKPG